MTQHVAIIGAGIVGAACALELLRDGHQRHDHRTRRARRRAGRQLWQRHAAEPEFGHSDVDTGDLEARCRVFARSAGAADDPLALFAASGCPWLRRFIAPGRRRRTRDDRTRVATAAGRCAGTSSRLAEEAGVGDLIMRQGVLFAFPDRAAFEAEALSWRIRRDNGTRWLELDEDELRQREPSLSRRYKFALLVEENGQCRDPGAYVAALMRHAVASGATLRNARATGFRIENRPPCGRC